MPVILLSIFVSLLPARWRGYWLGDANLDVRRGAILSASVQFVGCCAAIWARYPAFLRASFGQVSAAAGHGDHVVEGFTTFAYGPILLVAYIFRPITLSLLYFALEGAVRIIAAAGNDEVLPTLPLQVVAFVHELVQARYHEFELGPRIADLVEPGVPGKYDLKIRSCRPKAWNALITVRYNDEMYELQSEETGQAPRPFVYLLRRRPEHKIVRGLHDYHPDEAMHKPGWAEVPETSHK